MSVVNIIMVPLQRRYGFTATQAAMIPVAQDVFGAIFAILGGYIGGYISTWVSNRKSARLCTSLRL